jgi:hypothetical protein
MEAPVNDDSRTLTATIAGAVIGGVVGYLFFTARGRELRRELEPALDDLARELNSFRHTLRKAAGVASEGWRMLNEAAAEPGAHAPRYPTAHQSSPF